MAISLTTLKSEILTPTANVFVSSSFTPSANALLLANFAIRLDGGPGSEAIFALTGNSLTYGRTLERSISTGSSTRQMGLFSALTGASPSAGALTFTMGSGVNFTGTAVASIIQATGTDLVAPVGTAGSGVVDGVMSLPAITIPGSPTGNDITYALFAAEDNPNTFTASPGSWASFQATGPSSDARCEVFQNTAKDQGPSWTWATTNVAAGAIGVILKAGAGAATPAWGFEQGGAVSMNQAQPKAAGGSPQRSMLGWRQHLSGLWIPPTRQLCPA